MKEETTLRQDIKTAWVDGCKGLVGWLASFGKPKTNPALDKEMMMMKNLPKGAIKMATTKKPKRARGKKGKFLADDPTTKDINEAWVGGKSPKKGKKKNG